MAQRRVEPPMTRPFDAPDERLEAVYLGDDDSTAELYKLRLELDGYWVTVVTTPANAFAASRRRPDIVFVDVGATDESVLEAIGNLRLHRQLSDVPVVLLWGGACAPPVIEGLPIGVSNFMVKAVGVSTGSRSSESLERRVVSGQLH